MSLHFNCHLLTAVAHETLFLFTRYVIPQARLRHLCAPFAACDVIGLAVIPHGEARSAPAVGPHPPAGPSSLQPDPAACHVTAQRVVQPVLVTHAVHSGQVGVLYSAEPLSLMPGQGLIDEAEQLKVFQEMQNR